MQLDEAERGFSFQKEGPLDMRQDPTATMTAKDVVNKLSEKELGHMFRDLGEERLWRKAAKAIVEERRKDPFETTTQLSNTVMKAFGGKRGKLHPATKIFQAIRMYVNKELESIEGTLKKAIDVLAPEGKVSVLSFHSLEDRIVKNIFRDASKPLRDLQGRVTGEAVVTNMTKKPLTPKLKERKFNRRSRSAKLRIAKRISKAAVVRGH